MRCIIGLLIAIRFFISAAYLNIEQMTFVKSIIRNPDVPTDVITKTRECLAYNFIPFTLNEFRAFTTRNRRYMKNIHYNDLRQYAIMGLCDASKKYNGTGSFFSYSKKYILGSLHTGLTILEPLKPQTTYGRLNGIKKPTIIFSNNEWLHSLNKDFIEEKQLFSIEKMEQIKNIVDRLTPFEKRLFYYRYCENTLKEIRSISHVSALMVITESCYRKRMFTIMEKIREGLEVL